MSGLYLEREDTNCCGVLEIFQFPHSLDPYEDGFEDLIEYKEVGKPDEWDEKEILPSKKRMLEFVEEGLQEALAERSERPYSHYIVTLIAKQKLLFNAMLKRNGFKMVGSAINGNTTNRVWMYVKLRPEKVVKPKRKPRKGEWNY